MDKIFETNFSFHISALREKLNFHFSGVLLLLKKFSFRSKTEYLATNLVLWVIEYIQNSITICKR